MIQFKIILIFTLLSVGALGQGNPAMFSRNEPLTRILFIYDASNSMNGSWQSGKKNDIAKRLMGETLDSLKDVQNLEMALRVYGHQKDYRVGQDCNDTKLEIPFARYNGNKIKARLNKIVAKGTTPIAKTLNKSEADFTPCENCRNIIILITDGIEECGGDPCEVSARLQMKGIVLKPFVIGIGIDPNFQESFECMGTFYNAGDEKTFKTVMNIVISQALNSTSMQVNLLNKNREPKETNVNMTFTDINSGKEIYNFIHSFNGLGYPDTLKVEPLYTYKIKVHTIPPVFKDSVSITPGIHNIVGIPAPQGFLNLKVLGVTDRNSVNAIIRQKDKMETLHVQKTNSTVKYLIGEYDIEVLTMPRIIIEDVKVLQSHTTTIDIPQPGILTMIKPNYSRTDVYQVTDKGLKWIYQMGEKAKSVTLNLQPGNYKVVHKPNNAKGSAFTLTKEIEIKSGKSSTLKF